MPNFDNLFRLNFDFDLPDIDFGVAAMLFERGWMYLQWDCSGNVEKKCSAAVSLSIEDSTIDNLTIDYSTIDNSTIDNSTSDSSVSNSSQVDQSSQMSPTTTSSTTMSDYYNPDNLDEIYDDDGISMAVSLNCVSLVADHGVGWRLRRQVPSSLKPK